MQDNKLTFFQLQAELPRGSLISGYHAIYSTPWAPDAQVYNLFYFSFSQFGAFRNDVI